MSSFDGDKQFNESWVEIVILSVMLSLVGAKRKME